MSKQQDSNMDDSLNFKKKPPVSINNFCIRNFLQKFLTVAFTFVVFLFAYYKIDHHREILTFMGTILLMVIVYTEILLLRDHLWVLEGGLRQTKVWRDYFFNRTSIRKQNLRKMFLAIFTFFVFSFVYLNSSSENRSLMIFMGIVMMIIVIYYEILSLRDELARISIAIRNIEEDEKNGSDSAELSED